MRSYLDLSKDEVAHAMALHKESYVVDASLVAYLDYVGEDIWVDDMIRGGLTASNATVAMQNSLTEALNELNQYHSWAEKTKDKALIVRKAEDIKKAKREGKHSHLWPTRQQLPRGEPQFPEDSLRLGYSRNSAHLQQQERCRRRL